MLRRYLLKNQYLVSGLLSNTFAVLVIGLIRSVGCYSFCRLHRLLGFFLFVPAKHQVTTLLLTALIFWRIRAVGETLILDVQSLNGVRKSNDHSVVVFKVYFARMGKGKTYG